MTRWLALALIGVAVSGPATAAPREGDVVVFRTSGQPERRLKVLRVSAFPDGESLADVEDLATGDRFTLPGKVLAAAGRTRSQTSPAAGMEENRQGGEPSTPHPGPPPQGGRGPEGSGNLLLPPPGRGEGGGRSAVGDTVGNGQPRLTASPEPESTIVRVRLREWAPPVVILPVSANLPVDDATTAPEPQQSPPVPQSMPAPQPHPSAEAQMFAEIKPLVANLHTALRPTVREDAATGLAEGRYASRPEVKATLAYAAMTDPAPSVRAHCIRCLSTLGYHHPVYVDYLRACAGSGAGEVQAAAAGALAKLAPRK